MKYVTLLAVIVLFSGCCGTPDVDWTPPSRESTLPSDLAKMTPELDTYPPILHSNEYETPVPLAVINTVGGEDSPFIPVDGNELFFFFTPDVREPLEKQVSDNTTGIYVSRKINGAWQTAERVVLQDVGKLALDGCSFVKGDEIMFCTAREGYTGLHWFKADRNEGVWSNWRKVEFPEEYEVGELHIHDNELYYHSTRAGGLGENDIWMITQENDVWMNPINIEVVNSPEGEGMPYITPNGNELWFNRWYLGSPSVFRSKKMNGEWQEPELIVSQFAGEPTLDSEGNLYFVHHYYQDSVMLEADIYVAYRK